MASGGLTHSERQRVDRARELLVKAVGHEERGTLALALSHYSRALEHLIPLLYSSRCTGRVRATLRHKCRQYLDRARALRDVIRGRRDVTGGDDGVNTDDGTDGERDEAGGGRGEVEERERLMKMAKDLEENESRSDGDADQENDRRHATNHNGREKENRSTQDRGQSRQEAPGHSDEYPSDQLNGAVGLNVPVASGQDGISDKSTEGRNRQNDLPENQTPEDQIPETLAATLDAMLVQTDSARSATQSVCRWLEAPGVGLEEVEMHLKETVLLPVLFPQLFTAHMFRGRRRLLLYGHSGDGVLPLLHHFIRLCNTLTLFTISAHSLVALAMAGENGRDVMNALWSRARTAAPCALCVTDLDIFRLESAVQEDSPYPQELIRMLMTDLICHLDNFNELKELIMFIGVTSRPWLLNRSRLLRRFDLRRFCRPPSAEQRMAVLMSTLEGVNHQLDNGDLRQIATLTATFSRSDMAVLAEEAQARLRQRVQETRSFRTVTVPRHNAVAMPREGGNTCARGNQDGHEDDAEAVGSDDGDMTDNHDIAENDSSQLMNTSQSSSHRFNTTRCSQVTNNAVSDVVLYTPCDASDSDAIAMTWQEVEGHQLLEPPLTLQDVKAALRDLNSQVDYSDRQRMTSWHEDFGQY